MKRVRALSLLLALFGLVIVTTCAFNVVAAASEQADRGQALGLSKLGAGFAIGLAACGAGIGLGTVSAAAIGAIAEKPELFGRTMIYVVFVEAVAIYGLVISLLLWMAT